MIAEVVFVPSAPLLLAEYTGIEDVGAELRERCVDALRSALVAHTDGALEPAAPDGGMFLWARLPEDAAPAEALLRTAVDHGVAFVPGTAFFPDSDRGHHHIRCSFATLDPAKKAHGVTAFLVEKGARGLAQGPAVEKMGLRTALMGEVRLEDCFVKEDALLGREGGGLALFNHAMEWERGMILAPALG